MSTIQVGLTNQVCSLEHTKRFSAMAFQVTVWISRTHQPEKKWMKRKYRSGKYE